MYTKFLTLHSFHISHVTCYTWTKLFLSSCLKVFIVNGNIITKFKNAKKQNKKIKRILFTLYIERVTLLLVSQYQMISMNKNLPVKIQKKKCYLIKVHKRLANCHILIRCLVKIKKDNLFLKEVSIQNFGVSMGFLFCVSPNSELI